MFTAKDKKSNKAVSSKLSAGVQALLTSAASDVNFTGDKKESVFYRQTNVDGYTNILLMGLGDTAWINNESVRVAGALTLQALRHHKVLSAAVHADSIFKFAKDSLQALVEGFELADYDYADLKTTGKSSAKTPAKPTLKEVTLLLPAAPAPPSKKPCSAPKF